MEARPIFSKPAVDGVVITLSVQEAIDLRRFVGSTSGLTVEEVLGVRGKSEEATRINDLLFNIYETLNKVSELPNYEQF